MAAGTQGRIPRGGKWPLAPREGFPAAGNGRWHPGKNSPRRGIFTEIKTASLKCPETPFSSYSTQKHLSSLPFTPSLLFHSSFTPSLLKNVGDDSSIGKNRRRFVFILIVESQLPMGFSWVKKSLPLSSTRIKAGKSSTRIFHTASMPISGNSTHSMLLMELSERTAAGPPMLPR